MSNVRVRVTQWIGGDRGLVECEFVDTANRVWKFLEPASAVASDHALNEATNYHTFVALACEFVSQRLETGGYVAVTIDTCGAQFKATSTEGEHRFEVWGGLLCDRGRYETPEHLAQLGSVHEVSVGPLALFPEERKNSRTPVDRAGPETNDWVGSSDWCPQAQETPRGRRPTTALFKRVSAKDAAVIVLVVVIIVWVIVFPARGTLICEWGYLLVVLMVSILIPPSILRVVMESWRLRRRKRRNQCVECGYSRRGLADSGPCPECGAASWRSMM
jgi:hypothetical protein